MSDMTPEQLAEIESQSYKLILDSLCQRLGDIAEEIANLSGEVMRLNDKLDHVSGKFGSSSHNPDGYGFIRASVIE